MVRRNHFAVMVILSISACGTNTESDDIEDRDVVSTSVSIPSPPKHGVHEPSLPETPTTVTLPAKELEVTYGSVVDSKKHVVVNAANQWLAPGGALSGAIFAAGGQEQILAEIKRETGHSNATMSGTPLLKVAEVFTTQTYGGTLKDNGTQFILHALGPDFREKEYAGDAGLQKGYADLRTTYKNVYAEMSRLNDSDGVTTIGVIPISSGVFLGGAKRDTVYDIMLDETLAAMNNYPTLQPELYLFGRDAYNDVKRLLKPAVQRFTAHTGGSATALSSGTTFVSLLNQPYIELNHGNGQTKGFSTALGALHLMGVSSSGTSQQITHVMAGHTFSDSLFVGTALEYGAWHNRLSHYAWTIHAMCPVYRGVNIGGNLGYMVENTNVYLPNNMYRFLEHLGYSKCEFQQGFPMMEGAVQINISAGNQCGIVAEMCMRSLFHGELISKAIGRLTLNAHHVKFSGFVASDEFGFNIDLNI